MKEKYHKLCIVVEEADETVFWIELLQESNLIPNYDFQDIIQEANEIMKVMSTYRSRLKR